jgi:tetratricopeptide (TPR) repeat protein
MLEYETAMAPEAYQQYQAHITAIAAEPENPVPLLELMEWLVCQGLGKQALAALKRALAVIESLAEWGFSGHEMAACRILYAKLASKYYLKYEKPGVFYGLVDSFPESPFVLSHAAFYFMEMKYHDQAELLFLGALMLQPNYERALLGYSRLLAEKGNTRTALRYLGRINEESPLWLAAKLEMACIQELHGADTSAVLVAYKNCTLVTAYAEDAAFATALHCAAYHHHRLHEADKETFYLTRALVRNPNNAVALMMTATYGVVRLLQRENGSTSQANGPATTAPSERPRTAQARASPQPESSPAPRFTRDELDAKFRSGVLLAPRRRYRWIAALGYADFVNCVMRDTHRAEQYYQEASKISFSYSVWGTLALAHFHQYTRGEAGVAGRLLLRLLRHRHSDVAIDCLTAFNAFRHREVDADPTTELLKYMSLPTASTAAAGAPLVETQDDLEIAALYVVVAFYLMDLQEWDDAMKYAAAAIRINETFSPALRCIALITWQHGNTRKASLRYFEAALEFGAMNPYVLRTCAVVKAMEGHHEDAVALLQSALKISPNCPLTLRALAMMCYLYRKDADAALDYLSSSFALSNSEDIECLRLRGQILMDLGRHKEARTAFQQALYIVPWDAVTLASLGYCVSLLYKKDPNRNTANGTRRGEEPSYSSRLMSMRSPEELIHSRDPEELFEASVTMDLQRIFAGQANLSATGSEQYVKIKSKRAVNPFGQSNGMVLSNFAVEHELEETDTDFGNNMTGYAYYWYGMYEMKKTKRYNAYKCRTLFTLASKVAAPGASSSCNALAMYRLGEQAEREGNIDLAEKHYQSAVECSPMDPHAVLRLMGLVEQGLAGIKKLIRLLEAPQKRKGGKKAHKHAASSQLDASGTLSTYHPPQRGNVHDSSLVHNLTALLSAPLNVLHEDDAEDEDNRALHGIHQNEEAADPLRDYQRRLLLHQRIHEMATLKKRAYRKTLSEAVPIKPAHHVFADSYWLERLLHAFSTCEDWARLHQCASQVKPQKPAAMKRK